MLLVGKFAKAKYQLWKRWTWKVNTTLSVKSLHQFLSFVVISNSVMLLPILFMKAYNSLSFMFFFFSHKVYLWIKIHSGYFLKFSVCFTMNQLVSNWGTKILQQITIIMHGFLKFLCITLQFQLFLVCLWYTTCKINYVPYFINSIFCIAIRRKCFIWCNL